MTLELPGFASAPESGLGWVTPASRVGVFTLSDLSSLCSLAEAAVPKKQVTEDPVAVEAKRSQIPKSCSWALSCSRYLSIIADRSLEREVPWPSATWLYTHDMRTLPAQREYHWSLSSFLKVYEAGRLVSRTQPE